MSNLPLHHKEILSVTEHNECSVSGNIVCTCGCDRFRIRYFGEQWDEHSFDIDEYQNKYACSVKAHCQSCSKEWLLYDFAKHGYNGLICDDGISVSDSELTEFIYGDEHYFTISMTVEYDDEEQFTEEILNDPPNGMSFTPDDRFNIWSWIVINLKCAESGKKLNSFVDSELA